MASLTKEELKNSLINHGIAPPPATARKDEFVALYEEHVAPIDEQAGEFSSDDEVTVSPRKKKSSQSSVKSTASSTKSSKGSKKVVTEESSVVVGEVDVDALDDQELFKLLKENGVDAGPVGDSTRSLYKKKLAQILSGTNIVANGSNGSNEFSDTEPEDEDQPSVVTTPQEPERRVSTRSRGSASKVFNKSATQSPPVETKTGLRKRITDELDSSTLRNTPTPRRSIHSYKVTETTRETIVLNKDGVETRDTTHTLEKSESKEEEAKKAPFFTCKKIVFLLLIVAGAVVLFFLLTKQKDIMSVDNIMDSLQESMKKAPAAAAPPVAAPAPTPAPTPAPAQDIPEQPSLADV